MRQPSFMVSALCVPLKNFSLSSRPWRYSSTLHSRSLLICCDYPQATGWGPSLKCDSDVKTDVATGTCQEGMRGFIAHIGEVSWESRAGPQSKSWASKERRLPWNFYCGFDVEARVRVPMCGQGPCVVWISH